MYNMTKMEASSSYDFFRVVRIIQTRVSFPRSAELLLIVMYGFLISNPRTLAWRVVGALQRERKYERIN